MQPLFYKSADIHLNDGVTPNGRPRSTAFCCDDVEIHDDWIIIGRGNQPGTDIDTPSFPGRTLIPVHRVSAIEPRGNATELPRQVPSATVADES